MYAKAEPPIQECLTKIAKTLSLTEPKTHPDGPDRCNGGNPARQFQSIPLPVIA